MNKSRLELGKILEELDPFIQAQARSKFPPGLVRPEVLDLEKDELVQQTRVKLWNALQKREINNLHAYVSRMISNGAVDVIRKYKKFASLPDDE